MKSNPLNIESHAYNPGTPCRAVRQGHEGGIEQSPRHQHDRHGHMGREDLGVKWENTDRVDELKAAVAAL